MLLTARALGLGTTLTTLYLQFEKEAEVALGLPPNDHFYALLPIGPPTGRFAVLWERDPVLCVAPFPNLKADQPQDQSGAGMRAVATADA